MKVDLPDGGAYQMAVVSVDYAAFETALEHRNPQRGMLNRVYVQRQNRGVLPASNVVVKIYAEATPGPAGPPGRLLDRVPGQLRHVKPMDTDWRGADHRFAQAGTSRRAGMGLDAADVRGGPLPPARSPPAARILPGVKALVLELPVTQNRQVGLKNRHIIDVLPSLLECDPVYPRATTDIFRFGALPKGWSLSLVLPKQVPPSKITYTGYKAKLVSRAERTRISKQLGKQAELYDLRRRW